MRMTLVRKIALLVLALGALHVLMAPIADEAFETAYQNPELALIGAPGFSGGASAEELGAISISPAVVEVGLGATVAIHYAVDGTLNALNVEWTSSDPEIATVAPGGAVTGITEGMCVITGVSYSGQTVNVRVKVYPAPTLVLLSPASVTLGTGERYPIRPILSAGSRASFTYRSSNPSVASVDDSGVVTANRRGSAVITLRTHNGVSATLKVTVARAPASVRFRSERILAFTGETVRAVIALPSGTASIIKYQSSDPAVARVDSTGRVTGVSAGVATITATTFNGSTAECPVVVYVPPAAIVAPEHVEAVAGVPMAFDVWAELDSGERFLGEIDYDCADPDIACVIDGVLYPMRRGETYITLTAHRISRRVYISVGRYGDAYATLVAAHRGGKSAPENTLSAITGAVAQGVDYVEIDVRRTADGELVLMHDATITRTSNSIGKVSKLTLEQLRSVNFKGHPICTLDEALAYLAGTGVKVLLEMKAAGIEADCVETVDRYDMHEQVTYISFSLSALTAVRDAHADAQIGYLYISDVFDPVAFATQYDIDMMLPYLRLIDEAYVAALHNAGVTVSTWTVNKRTDMLTVHRAGVDLIITDYVLTAQNAVGR